MPRCVECAQWRAGAGPSGAAMARKGYGICGGVDSAEGRATYKPADREFECEIFVTANAGVAEQRMMFIAKQDAAFSARIQALMEKESNEPNRQAA